MSCVAVHQYLNFANVPSFSQMQKLEGYFSASQVPMVQSIIDHFIKTIEIRKTLDGETNKVGITIIALHILTSYSSNC